MNLLELKQQAGIQDNPDQEGLDLFAKLIVLKCAEFADTAEPFLASDLIKEHFGVEE